MIERKGQQEEQGSREPIITPEGKAIIDLFQQAQHAEEEEKKRILQEFIKRIVKALSPSEQSSFLAKDQGVPKILLTGEKKYFGDDCMHLGGGTAGQRIFFRESVFLTDPERAEDLGKDAIREETKTDILLKSRDGKVRWMAYPFPEGNDYKFGKEYWVKFIEVFGGDIVDLLQPLK